MEDEGKFTPEGGRRRKLTRVTKKRANRALKKLGLKLRGGGDSAAPEVVPDPTATAGAKLGGGLPVASGASPVTGGRRRRTGKATRRRHRGRKMWPF